MNCDQAANFIWARLDGELTGGDALELDAHLAECAACRAMVAEAEVHDAALVRAFSSRQQVAGALGDRVTRMMEAEAERAAHSVNRSALCQPSRWMGWSIAAAAGFLAAMLAVQVVGRLEKAPQAFAPPKPPVARLTLATGEVFTCPSDGEAWRLLAPGESVSAGSQVKTASNAKCELQLASGACVRLNTGTQARLLGVASVRVDSGQVWSNLQQDESCKTPVQVVAGPAQVLAGSATQPTRGSNQVDVACNAGSAMISVSKGSVFVCPSGSSELPPAPTVVRGGQVLHVPVSSDAAAMCAANPDPMLTARWQDELLVLKPADDPEVVARAAELLKHITGERADLASATAATQAAIASNGPGPIEQDVRTHGQAWSASFACVVRGPTSKPDRDTRRTAARLLADLAPPRCIPDLIELLADEDSEVRRHAATALRRLTGQTLGHSADQCAERRDPTVVVEWRAWWAGQKLRR
jgi:hypothetical protein